MRPQAHERLPPVFEPIEKKAGSMAETAYLQENVGEALKMALAAMVVDQPDDAVEFIGTYLVNHATKHEREEARAKKYAALAESIAVSDAAAAEVAAAAEARRTASDPTEAEAELERAAVDRASVSNVPIVDVARVVRWAFHAREMVWVA